MPFVRNGSAYIRNSLLFSLLNGWQGWLWCVVSDAVRQDQPLFITMHVEATRKIGLLQISASSRHSDRFPLQFKAVFLFAKMLDSHFPMGVVLTWRAHYGSFYLKSYSKDVKIRLPCSLDLNGTASFHHIFTFCHIPQVIWACIGV